MEAKKKILKRYPIIEKKLKDPKNPNINLTTQETVFMQLVNFFEKPNVHQLSLNWIYEHLQDEDLLFALETIIVFFQKDTMLVQDVSQNFYEKSLLREEIVGQSKFAEMVESSIEGIKFPPSYLYMYWKRRSDKIPKPDLIISGTPYWKVSAVNKFIAAKRRELKTKKKK